MTSTLIALGYMAALTLAAARRRAVRLDNRYIRPSEREYLAWAMSLNGKEVA